MKPKLLLLAVALVAVAAWHWTAYSDPRFYVGLDELHIINGYRATPDVWRDGVKWWYGTWLHGGAPSFRPLASYAHWWQVYTGFRIENGWHLVIISTMVSFAVTCWLMGVLAMRLSGSKLAGLAVVVACTAIHINGDPAAGHTDFLQWWPVCDFLWSTIGLLSALLCYDKWLESNRPVWMAATWLFMLVGILFKEYAYIFPVMALCLTMTRGRFDKERFYPVACMFAAVLLLASYRGAVIGPNAHDGYANGPSAQVIDALGRPILKMAYYQRSDLLSFAIVYPVEIMVFVLRSAVLLVAAWYGLRAAWQHRQNTPVGAALLLRLCAPLPFAPFGFGGYRSMPAYMFGAALWCVAVAAVWPSLMRLRKHAPRQSTQDSIALGVGKCRAALQLLQNWR